MDKGVAPGPHGPLKIKPFALSFQQAFRPSNSVKALKETQDTNLDHGPRKIVNWPHHFLIHHWNGRQCHVTASKNKSMSVLVIFGQKCTLAASHAPLLSHVEYAPTSQTDGRTDARLLHYRNSW